MRQRLEQQETAVVEQELNELIRVTLEMEAELTSVVSKDQN
ncbi:MAG: hypothetical protein ACE5ES_00405 [Candidatus Nanoarchaeia archaeon]